ncbi:MAG TPA: hypothetical protein VNJ04_03100 [Gemmatimonadaceae bacterium]|nr:hypothetical protein [Gemmatimonadaceae bacterium]
MRVGVVSTGVEIDNNGYTLSVDGGTDLPIGTHAAIVLGGLAVGEHTVGLAGLAANCTVSGANPQAIRVTGTDTVTAFFQVACTSTRGTLQITATTTGTDLDPSGYLVFIQSPPNGAVVGANQSKFIPGLSAGTYTATISGVAPNCTLNGPATRTFTITPGATTQFPIQVTCSALPTFLGFPFSDPAGDTLADPRGRSGPQAIDLLEIMGIYKADSLIMTLRFAAPIRPAAAQVPNSLAGLLELDTDENVSTGTPPFTNNEGGNAPLGVDYTITLNSIDSTTVQISSSVGGFPPFRARAEYSGSSLTIRLPLALIGNDDGNFKFAGLIGAPARPTTDVAPNAGVYTARRPGTSAQMAPVRTSGAVPTLSGSATDTNYVPRSWSERK